MQITEGIGIAAQTHDYQYDLAGRLIEVKENGSPAATYAYDNNNNRLSYVGSLGSYAGIYDDQDRLLQYGGATFTYSANGELTEMSVGAQTTTYGYDAVGNLVNVTLPGGSQIEYVVDGLNRRIGKKVNAALVQGFLYKDRVNPLAELDSAGNVVSQFVYGSRTHVPDYLIKNGDAYRIISDHLGSPRLIVHAATGAIAQQLTYDEFGNILSDTNPGFQPFGFAGGLYDPDTGLVRFGARDYDPETGRWLSKDPSRFRKAETNLYEYVRCDPVNLIDPLGNAAESASSADVQLPSIPDLSWESVGQWATDTVRDVAGGQIVGAVADALDMVQVVDFASGVAGAVQGVIDTALGLLDDALVFQEIATDPSRSEPEIFAGVLTCVQGYFSDLVGSTGGASGWYHEEVIRMSIGSLERGMEYSTRIRQTHADAANRAYQSQYR
jgi:RHS repeat-associated protein